MPESRCWGRRVWYHSYALSIRFAPFRLLLTFCCLGCDLLPHPGDTEGVQNQARWVSGGRLVVDTHPPLTILPLDIDTTAGPDALLARFDFDPTACAGDPHPVPPELDFRHVRELRTHT